MKIPEACSWMLKTWPVEHRLPRVLLQREVGMLIRSYAACIKGEGSENDHNAVPQLMLDYHTHQDSSALMYVSKQVTDDLLRSDIPEPDFASVVWPADTLLITFGDPEIPAVLLTHEIAEILAWATSVLGFVGRPTSETKTTSGVTFMTRNFDGTWCGIGKSYSEMDMLAAGTDKQEDLEAMGEMGQQNADLFSWMALLLFKVLMFASTPKFSPTVKKVKFDKPPVGYGYLSRPRMNQYIVEYLPHHIAEKKADAAKCGTSHSFRGRRGHWRTYASERYTNKQGSRDYIYPVPNPHGDDVKHKFIVRKP